ncbi:uncharacterized protein PGTG_07069 [Puccinia graminis f. sp. tritici CRL 75-36-700-3]|uniref:Tyr recombinase domain-containing protein n=1 Tax=Puccinia graminis f. sp. tritici (strain CRL 75-36-700-3 / race SCCL) TaxID=418459 RepID=E3KAP1_PUCGT|nr:uncharacterized protein PGTG_07069 [Puccinia graminis f. sp. tritici CRL 75-36-700-3]EFP81448.1 hypothetical protein PGTG_07069 [Puccinia graminis f. sp. tritici CRL 75-36-700-3]
MASLDLSKLTAFLANGSSPREPTAIDIHYLKGFKWNTIVSYNAAVKKFMKHRTETNRLPFVLPASADDIYQFFFWAGRNEEQQTTQEIKATTVEKYLYGIQAWHEYHSQPYPKESKSKVSTLLKSSAKIDAQVPDKPKKAAVQIRHLIFLNKHLEGKGPQAEAIRDLALTAFWGMARLAELTYPTESGQISKARSLLTSDIQFEHSSQGEVATLVLRNAKTCAPGETQTIQLRSLNNPLCPVRAIRRRLDECLQKETSLFGFYMEGKRYHLTRNMVVTAVRDAWKEGKFQGLSGHSFRVGGASLRFAMGVPTEEICQLGRWVSDCYKLYIRQYSAAEKAEAKKMLRQI